MKKNICLKQEILILVGGHGGMGVVGWVIWAVVLGKGGCSGGVEKDDGV